MAAKKRGLGKGLNALLSTPQVGEQQAVESSLTVAPKTSGEQLKELPIEWLQRGKYQPRRDMSQDALEELAQSIKAQGIMQPVVVRPIGENQYEIIAGERRWRASQLAQLDKIPVVIKQVTDEATIAMSLIENIQREDLNPVEEAMALHRLQDEFELTQQEVADAVGKSRTTVTNLLRLMSLNADVQKLLEYGDLEMGHAKVLLALTGEKQSSAAKEVVSKGLNVRQTEALVKSLKEGKKDNFKPTVDPDIKRLEDDLTDQLGAVVSVQHNAKGKGKLSIKYNSLDELDGILAHIKKSSYV
ncbi:MAG: ParB/RepB/Spo0J family partition protein [Cellvibrionales bacterium]|nr:ParB/RepB/Spo0J family partition protein [Cellvibrionales bacterium]